MTINQPPRRGYILHANQGLAPAQPDLKASADSTGGQLTVFTLSLNGGPPRHTHTREDESIYLFSGRLKVECDGEEFEAMPGSFVFLPRERPHTFTTWCAISFGVSSPGWWGDRLVAACYQAAARSDTSEPMARTVSGRSSRRPIQRCSGRQCLDPAMACSTQIRCEDWVWRACSQAWTTSGGASLAGFFGGTLTWAGWSRRRPR